MVNRVKGFCCVKKEKKLVLFLLDRCVKKIVDFDYMFRALPSGNKAFLGGVNISINGWHDAPCNASSQDPVVCVGDTEGPGVRDKASELFWEKEEETVVKTVRRRLALEDRFKDSPETVAAKSATARQAAKEMPSGPAAEFLESLMDFATSRREGSVARVGSTLLL